MSVLEFENVHKSLGGHPILNGVDLKLQKGEVIAIVGPSGSGKSTVLRCANRLHDPDEGAIKFDGANVDGLDARQLRSQVGMVFQDSAMFPGTVRENISFGLTVRGVDDPRVVAKAVAKAAKVAAVSRRHLDRSASKLSGGEKQRVAIARALAIGPEVLLLDEPTSEIDPKRLRHIEDALVSMAREGKTSFLWVTHSADQARRVGDRIANLVDGRITQIAQPDEFDWGVAY